jgi:hypothetical protein
MSLLLHIASLLIPPPHRAGWLREWRSELWYFGKIHGAVDRLRFSLGAFPDALAVRKEAPAGSLTNSPFVCIAFLVTAVTLSGILARVPPEPRIAAHAVMWILAGGFAALKDPLEPAHSGRYWAFLVSKVLLVSGLVLTLYCHAAVLSRTELQPHVLLVAHALTFRWVLQDQRGRCQVCLQRLEHPVALGQPANQLLEWCGTELVCAAGHGLRHEPAAIDGSYAAATWVRLDESWQTLFGHRAGAGS